eukprot:GCRY01001138.1.p1 GENE.GCRY01001138.1~~GCRY01001138.1.p1  ORF type:complete len:163 (-),score=12.11 GCRY01001138.1:922-1410(-)
MDLWFRLEVLSLYFLLCIDLISSLLFSSQDEFIASAMYFGIQLGGLFFFALLLAHLFMRTFLFQFGLLKLLFKEFRIIWITVLYISLFLLYALPRVLAANDGKNLDEIWDTPLIRGSFILHRIGGVFFYYFTLETSYRLGDSKLYTPTPEWQDRISRQLGPS